MGDRLYWFMIDVLNWLDEAFEWIGLIVIISGIGFGLYYLRGKWRKGLIALVILGLITSCGWDMWLYYRPLTQLSRARTLERAFTEADLLLQEAAIPETWLTEEVKTSDERIRWKASRIVYPLEYLTDPDTPVSIGNMIPYPTKTGVQWAARTLSHVDAKRYYQRNERMWLKEYRGGIGVNASVQRIIIAEVDFDSQLADRQRLLCKEHKSKFSTAVTVPVERIQIQTRCYYLAQYAEFVVYLEMPTVWDGRQLLAMEEFIKLVEEIDQTMVQHLKP